MKSLSQSKFQSLCHLLFAPLCAAALAYAIVLDSPTHVPNAVETTPAAVVELRLKQPVSEELGPGQQVTYALDVAAGQYVSMFVAKGDTNLQLTVSATSSTQLVDFVSYSFEGLRAAFIARRSDRHLIVLRSLEKASTPRQTTLTVQELRLGNAQDEKYIHALATGAEAREQQAKWTAQSSVLAIEGYEKTAAEWRAQGQISEAASALMEAGEVAFGLSKYAKALDHYERARTLALTAKDNRQLAQALNGLAYVHANTGSNKQAELFLNQVPPLCQKIAREFGEGESPLCMAQLENNLGEVYYYQGDLRRAKVQFSRSMELHLKNGNRRGATLAHLNLAYANLDSGALHISQAHLEKSLSLSLELGDRRFEALTNTARGLLFSFRGEKQAAFVAYKDALRVAHTIGDRQAEAAILNSTGTAYEDLNDPQSALDQYAQAWKIFHDDLNRDAEAVTLSYLGRASRLLGNDTLALDYFQQCLALSHHLGKERIENYALTEIASLKAKTAAPQSALAGYRKALGFYRKQDDKRVQAHLLSYIGGVYMSLRDWLKATTHYQQALALTREADDQQGVASMLYRLALAQSKRGENAQALSNIEEALRLSESLRLKVSRQDLRSAFFASVHDQVELYIDLLMKSDSEGNQTGLVKAFEASEAARARSLLEVLVTANLDLHKGLPSKLLQRERAIQDSLAAQARDQMNMLAKGADDDSLNQAEAETRRLTSEYQELQAEITEQGLRNAILEQPNPLRLPEIQQQLLDDDTVLLEYFLGEETSYVWAVTRSSIHSYKLGTRNELENLARDLYNLLSATDDSSSPSNSAVRPELLDQQYWQLAAKAGDVLLGQLTAELKGKKRLLIVSDGALQYLPFDALLVPAMSSGVDTPRPLLVDYEVVNLPSASMLAALRNRNLTPNTPDRLVAVLADPVFASDDPRVEVKIGQNIASTQDTQAFPLMSAFKSITRSGDVTLSRLPFTFQEAEAIVKSAPENSGTMITGFAANRDLVINGGLQPYRIVHFATHGVINCEHPELSGIVLSMLNEHGERENGFLQLHDIYRLELSADLVVLSACRTALGQNIRGEGLVGLTQGFFNRGANTVVSTLWTIDDRASAELMQHFYEAMLQEGATSSAALRSAKQKLLSERRWQSPYYWAAFVVQGDYRQTIKAQNVRSHWPVMTTMIVIALITCTALAIWLVLVKPRNSREST